MSAEPLLQSDGAPRGGDAGACAELAEAGHAPAVRLSVHALQVAPPDKAMELLEQHGVVTLGTMHVKVRLGLEGVLEHTAHGTLGASRGGQHREALVASQPLSCACDRCLSPGCGCPLPIGMGPGGPGQQLKARTRACLLRQRAAMFAWGQTETDEQQTASMPAMQQADGRDSRVPSRRTAANKRRACWAAQQLVDTAVRSAVPPAPRRQHANGDILLTSAPLRRHPLGSRQRTHPQEAALKQALGTDGDDLLTTGAPEAPPGGIDWRSFWAARLPKPGAAPGGRNKQGARPRRAPWAGRDAEFRQRGGRGRAHRIVER